MFCYQLNTATLNLIDPPTVDSTYERNMTVDDMPLITICPTNQTNITRMNELGYFDLLGSILEGSTYGNKITRVSWGEHVNLTFDELKSQLFDLDRVDNLFIYGVKSKSTNVFIPRYGLCKETVPLNVAQQIGVMHYNSYNFDDARVVITDKNYRSYFMPDGESHVGMPIFMNSKTMHYINVKIHERLTCMNEEKAMSQEDFRICVDDKIQNEFEKNNVSCVPPWLSYNKQCNQTYPTRHGFYGKFYTVFFKSYLEILNMFSNIRFEEECRHSCKVNTYIITEKDSRKHAFSKSYLTFNQKVLVTEKVPNYDMFKYIIDVGSSLGLWLGLSVLGLHDLVVWAVQFVNNSFIIKKIRSAVTK